MRAFKGVCRMLKGSVFPLDKHKGGMDDVEEEDDDDDDSDSSDR